jgi:EmrB/QacA subfamily drug resistance transporter
VSTAANRKWWTLGALTFSLFMIMLDNTVVNVALPAIQHGVGASLSQLEWIVEAYALVFAVLLVSGGKLADFLGRRRIFVAGLVIFTLASLWCALSTSGGMLIAARGAQGIGAALMLPATVSIIAVTFTGRDRGLAFGIWAGVAGVGLAIGPLVGGLLVETASWSWIFYVNVPVGLIGLVATFLFVPESRDASADQRLDIAGLLTSGGAMFALTYGLIEANTHGWGSTLIVTCFAVSAVLIVAFVLLELRQRAPMLDLALFRDSTFTGANTVGLLIMCALFGFIFFMSIYLQSIRGYSPLQAGATFLVSTVAMGIAAPISGKVTDRFGGRWPITIGQLLFGISLIGLSVQITAHVAIGALYPLLFIGGFGFGLVLPPATALVVSSVPPDKTGVASGTMQALRQLGGALGVAIAGAIMNASLGVLAPLGPQYVTAFVSGLKHVLLFCGVVAVAGAVVAVFLVRRGAAESESELAEVPSL